ncbi:ferredoxin reductase-like C-terminal NADP-linked domain-containing protein [Wolfiporia cocos MD-104 SS10]|uniref:NADH-cytochrome b5 reductase n=1 Tax=Wolfiporia cocos (strain MD-104) TaxID=742152 RepID=A0A2H3IYI1_WOLCO|nr:ferredoxin reductase-like C-terminal NADP-linked domain-containing protein [Wolfiporia cocos MD-104 SS10]
MSFARFAFSARALHRQAASSARRYSTAPDASKKPSNLPLYLGGAGCAGIAAYIYLKQSGSAKAAATPKKDLTSPLDPQKWVEFELKRIEPYNHNTAKYIFKLPEGQASLMPVASCVLVEPAEGARPLLDDKGKPVHRPYTPISPPDLEGEFTFLIKRYEQGQMSQYIHALKPGEKLAIKGPLTKIPYKQNEWDEVGMIAGGSGITPMYQVLKHALADPSNKTKFTLLFANISERDILLREEFDQLKKEHPDTLNVIYTVDKADSNWKGYTGYINKEMIAKHIAPASLGNKVKVLVCGPPGQVNAIAGKKESIAKQGPVSGILKELGYTEDQVFKF